MISIKEIISHSFFISAKRLILTLKIGDDFMIKLHFTHITFLIDNGTDSNIRSSISIRILCSNGQNNVEIMLLFIKEQTLNH